MPPFNPLLNPPAYPAERYAPLADRLKRLLGTSNDVVFVQGEAIVALEAAAASLSRPGMVAVNIVTSPYGGYFGQWLERGGASITEITAQAGRPIGVDAVRAALSTLPRVDLVAIVHAETSSGMLNPLPEIAALAKAHGALLVVDAVASFGGHALDVDALGLDVCVTGPQKAIGGSAGLSMVSVSARAWDSMAKAAARAPSTLSLLDLKHHWIEQGRGAVPGMPSALEFWALEAALDAVEAEGLDNRLARHALAAKATRAGLVAMGIEPWIDDDNEASALATAAPVPPGIDGDALIANAAALGVSLTAGYGAVRGRLVRLDHSGTRAAFPSVIATVIGYGAALARLGHPVDIGRAAAAIAAAYERGPLHAN